MADEKKVTDAEVAEKKAKKADNKKAKKAPSKFSPKNIGKGIIRFFKDLRGETKKIVWPNAKMVVKSTGVVLATVLILGAGVWVLDFATSGAITAVMNAAETEVTETVTDSSSEEEHDHEHDEEEEDTTEGTTAE